MSDPLEPHRLSLGSFKRLCKDVGINFPVELAFQRASARKRCLSFSDFLEALRMVAVAEGQESKDEALERTLRKMGDGKKLEQDETMVAEVLNDRDVKRLRAEFEDDLMRIFGAYGDGNRAPMTYGNFLRFTHDWGFHAGRILTTVQVGEAFLGTMRKPLDSDALALSKDRLWEVLVRCAVSAFPSPRLSLLDRVKSLLLMMFNASQSAPVGSSASDIFTSSKTGVEFKNKFLQMWHQDKYRVYTLPSPDSKPVSARYFLQQLSSPTRYPLIVNQAVE